LFENLIGKKVEERGVYDNGNRAKLHLASKNFKIQQNVGKLNLKRTDGAEGEERKFSLFSFLILFMYLFLFFSYM
jgi:hypothetical protein